jgi:hypothetical protein
MRCRSSEITTLNRESLRDRLLTKEEVMQIPFEELIIPLLIEKPKAMANPNPEESLQRRRLLQSELFRRL